MNTHKLETKEELEKKYPLADWTHEVLEGNTRLGYEEWTQHRAEAEALPVETVEVEVCDIQVTRRSVKIPTKCPKCSADLTETSSLKVWEFQDQSRGACFVGGALDWTEHLPEGGESFMQVSFRCAACDYMLAEGKESEKPSLECYDCGQPAKFHVFCYGNREKTPQTLFCALCAIEKIVDGSPAERTEEHEKELGYENRTT